MLKSATMDGRGLDVQYRWEWIEDDLEDSNCNKPSTVGESHIQENRRPVCRASSQEFLSDEH
jgi:hypothetical protein